MKTKNKDDLMKTATKLLNDFYSFKKFEYLDELVLEHDIEELCKMETLLVDFTYILGEYRGKQND